MNHVPTRLFVCFDITERDRFAVARFLALAEPLATLEEVKGVLVAEGVGALNEHGQHFRNAYREWVERGRV